MNAARHNVHMSEIKLSNILVITLIQYCGFVVFPLNIYSPEKNGFIIFHTFCSGKIFMFFFSPYFLFQDNIVDLYFCSRGYVVDFFNMLLSWENIVSLWLFHEQYWNDIFSYFVQRQNYGLFFQGHDRDNLGHHNSPLHH